MAEQTPAAGHTAGLAARIDATIKERESQIAAIIVECNEHNADVGEDPRDPERVRCDAEFILMHRRGISVETICMMLTDTEFALRKAKAALSPAPAPSEEEQV